MAAKTTSKKSTTKKSKIGQPIDNTLFAMPTPPDQTGIVPVLGASSVIAGEQTSTTLKRTKKGRFVPYMKTLDYGQVALGNQQNINNAPLEVPPGFTTQVPYNNASNSTIIRNPSPIPVTDYYKAMTTDPVVYSCMLYLITSIISRIGPYHNPDKKLEKLVRNTYARVGELKLKRALCASLWAGFATIKLNWSPVLIDGVTNIASIDQLPPDSVLLAVTPEGILDQDFGIMQYYYNINSGIQQNPYAYSSLRNAPLAAFGGTMSPQRSVSFNPMFLSALPEDWRIHHVFNPTGLAGNHYGVSMIQSIYSSLMSKQNQRIKIEIASTYKAAPMLFITTDTQTQVDMGDGTTISMAENVQNALPQGAETGYVIVEGMNSIKVTPIDNTADLDKMMIPVRYYDDQIRAGLITPDLVGNSGSYANAMANSSANEAIINNFTLDIIDTMMNQFVKKFLTFAVGEENVKDWGHFELLDNSLNDKAVWAKILETAGQLGLADMKSLDDVNLMRTKLGFSQVDKLSEDMIFGMTMSGARGANIAKTKEQIKQPYANGLDKVKTKQYAKK